jgi:transcriptional regulator with GAF, ATPase, and Fis domain
MEAQLQARLGEIERLKQQLEQENVFLREEVKHLFTHEEIVGQSDAMQRILVQVEQVAPTDSTVLIIGETGTGKNEYKSVRGLQRPPGMRVWPAASPGCHVFCRTKI